MEIYACTSRIKVDLDLLRVDLSGNGSLALAVTPWHPQEDVKLTVTVQRKGGKDEGYSKADSAHYQVSGNNSVQVVMLELMLSIRTASFAL